jgi:hypothetical protein
MPIGKSMDDLAFDPAGKRLYAPCGGDGLVYVNEQSARDKYTLARKVPSGAGGKNARCWTESLDRYFVIVARKRRPARSMSKV